MTQENMTPEQQRIAELFGKTAVLEEILTSVLMTGIENGTYFGEMVKTRLDAIRSQNQHRPENDWDRHRQSGANATVSRISAEIRIQEILLATRKPRNAES